MRVQDSFPQHDTSTEALISSTPTTAAGTDTTADQPYGNITPARRVLLAANRIELAVAEIRYNGRNNADHLEPLALRDALQAAGIPVTNVERTHRQDVNFTVTPTGPTTSATIDQGWQLATGDGHLTLTVFADQLIVQNTRYTRFRESLRPALHAALPVLHAQLGLALLQRIGLRYINRYIDEDAQHPTAWRDRIEPGVLGVLGVLGDSPFADAVTATQQQIELSLEASAGALIRHGAFRDAGARGAYSYLVDLDVYNTATEAFDTDTCLATARRLNRTALGLFQQIVTEQYRNTMKPYDPDTAQPETAAEGAPR